jgi:hypothetical protein
MKKLSRRCAVIAMIACSLFAATSHAAGAGIAASDRASPASESLPASPTARGAKLSGGLQIVGSFLLTYSNTAHTLTLSADQILNAGASTSGLLSLRVIGTAAPISGSLGTYVTFGEIPLQPLAPGSSYTNLVQTVALTPPPMGVYDAYLAIFEFDPACAAPDHYCLDSYRIFSSGLDVAEGLVSLDIPSTLATGTTQLLGGWGFQFAGSTVTLQAGGIFNDSTSINSSPLSLRLMLTTKPVEQASAYWTAAQQSFAALAPRAGYEDVSSVAPLQGAPDGIYFVSLALFEATPNCAAADGYCLTDYHTFGHLLQVSNNFYTTYSAPGAKSQVVEYYDAQFGHYFITPLPGEISALGKPPFDAWQPTGYTFNSYDAVGVPAGTIGVCRFFNDDFDGISTHFYAPHGLGCEDTIADFPDWQLESSQLFNAFLPDADGNCPVGNLPIYRLYNNGQGGAPNHRFTIDPRVRELMIHRGYVPEGAGIGVGWCAPS